MTRRIALAAAVLLIVLAGGCDQDRSEQGAQPPPKKSPAPTPTPTSHSVKIEGNCAFDEPSYKVWRDDTVVFTNTLNCEVRIWTQNAKLFGRKVDETIKAGDTSSTYIVSPAAVNGTKHDVFSDNPPTSTPACCPTPTPDSTAAESEEPIETLSRATFVIRDPRGPLGD